MSRFKQAFAIVVGEEGGLSTDPVDPGNWTGGIRGRGQCLGTKYGISAAAHPDVDIAGLSLVDAQVLYAQQYWQPVRGDELPPQLALVVFDTAVNCGTSKAIRWLQEAVGCQQDGVLGSLTLAAAQAPDHTISTCAHILASRLISMTTLPTWQHFGLGWTHRICALPYQAIS